jgi:hypothetical protein
VTLEIKPIRNRGRREAGHLALPKYQSAVGAGLLFRSWGFTTISKSSHRCVRFAGSRTQWQYLLGVPRKVDSTMGNGLTL